VTDVILPKLDQTGDNEWADVQDNDLALRNVINGQLDNGNLSGAAGITANNIDPALLSQMGVGTGLRGKSVIPTEESKSGASYGMLPTPDRVSGLNIPAAGFIAVHFDAKVKSSVAGAGRVAIYLNETDVRTRGNGQFPQSITAPTRATEPGTFVAVTATSFGLVAASRAINVGSPDLTTGQTLGEPFIDGFGMRYDLGGTIREVADEATGVCYIKAAAGTYDLSIRYFASSGSISAKERILYVWTEGF